MRLAWLLSLVSSLACVNAAGSVLTPPVLPLVVRNPYLSAWLPDARHAPWEKWPMFWTGEYIGFGVLASVHDTNTVYPLLGRQHDSLPHKPHGYNISFPEYLGSSYDASTTNLTYQIPTAHASSSSSKHVHITLSFLCPITPTSTLRQSLPACYLSVLAEGSSDISIYIDINGQWVSGDRASNIEWEYFQADTGLHGGLKTWKVKKQDEALFTENADRAEWGSLYFTGPSDAHHESGTSAILRQKFSSTNALSDKVDSEFRGIMDEEPVFAFSKTFNLSNNTKSNHFESALFTISHVQDPVVQYASARGLTQMRPLWKSWFFSDAEMLRYHYYDFKSVMKLAQNYSDQLEADAYKSGSKTYVDIVALGARQIMGATSFSGTPDNPLLFLKEISSNGNCQTVDVIFPSAPFFLYTNPRWLAYLLEPLLEHQLSGQYPNKYSMHDMGAHFPNQTGHSDGNDEYMPVEECGDMLIMGLALVNSLKYEKESNKGSIWSRAGHTGAIGGNADSVFPLTDLGFADGVRELDDSWGGNVKGEKQAMKWLTRSYTLWKQWTKYLVEFSLEPHNQLSTDDFAGWLALQTNLALKGIVGIKAMAEMSSLLGHNEDAKYYRNISTTFVKKWQDFGISRDGSHAKLAYNWYGSWTTLYSLFADALLCFHPSITSNPAFFDINSEEHSNHDSISAFRSGGQQPLGNPQNLDNSLASLASQDFIPHGVYTNQSAFYALVMQRYGLPLDSRHMYTKSDWQFEAAAVAQPKVRKQILDRVARWINETATDRPLSDLYDTEGDGDFPDGIYFMARPVVGGHFAFLALERACGQ